MHRLLAVYINRNTGVKKLELQSKNFV